MVILVRIQGFGERAETSVLRLSSVRSIEPGCSVSAILPPSKALAARSKPSTLVMDRASSFGSALPLMECSTCSRVRNVKTTVLKKKNDGLFCAYAYLAPFPEDTRSTWIS